MKILVIGGSGFIGTRLIDVLLEKDYNVKIFDKQDSLKYPDLITFGDVRNKDELIEATKDIDIIYNLAAEHADNVTPKSLYFDVNVGGAENIVTAAKLNNVEHIIFTSSVAVYGTHQLNPDETFESQATHEYGITKFKAEKVFNKWAKEDENRTLTIVRPAVVFGEKNRGNVYRLMNQISKKRFAMIGEGTNKKSMGYVGNIALFLAFLIDKKDGIEIFNFAGKPDLSTRELVDIISNELDNGYKVRNIPEWIGMLGGYTFDIVSKISGKKYPISSIRVKKLTADTSIATKKLLESGFEEKYTLIESIRKMIKYEFKS